jgi:hypothetical protein
MIKVNGTKRLTCGQVITGRCGAENNDIAPMCRFYSAIAIARGWETIACIENKGILKRVDKLSG